MKEKVKKINLAMFLCANLFSVCMPYFQRIHFDSENRGSIGFPFRYLTVSKEIKGASLFSSFNVSLGEYILCVLFFYCLLSFGLKAYERLKNRAFQINKNKI